MEDVKKLLGGNKLDTTFQIPKRTKPADSNSISDPSKAKSASTSPKYSISPKSGSSSGVGSYSSSASDFPPDLKSSSQKCGVSKN